MMPVIPSVKLTFDYAGVLNVKVYARDFVDPNKFDKWFHAKVFALLQRYHGQSIRSDTEAFINADVKRMLMEQLDIGEMWYVEQTMQWDCNGETDPNDILKRIV